MQQKKKIVMKDFKDKFVGLGKFVTKQQKAAPNALALDESVKDKDSPYAKGRMAWNELYGSTVTQLENSYRIIAMLVLVVILMGFVIGHIASQSKIEPYIVQVTEDGNVVTGEEAQSFSSSSVPANAIKGALYKFIVYSRGVTGDPDVDQDNIYAAQALTTGNAFSALSNYFEQNNPLILGKTQKVSIQVLYEIQRTANSYEVAWQETTTTPDDQPISQTNYIAEITYKLGDVKDIRYNPLGLYITDLTWTQQI